MKDQVTHPDFKVGDRVVVSTTRAWLKQYNDVAGTIERLGSAGDMIMLHVRFDDGYNTVMTLMPQDVKLAGDL